MGKLESNQMCGLWGKSYRIHRQQHRLETNPPCRCVLVEAILSEPLFGVNSEAELLLHMCITIGSPNLKDPRIEQLIRTKLEQIPSYFPRLPFNTLFPKTQLSPHGIHLIESMLQWLPQDRPDCTTALRDEPFLRN